ncbi:HNH endonuclease [Methanobacterium formicicum]|uniref:HNH nuclease domain-containing protein n=1 Tax=Methanobacterium formicicum (strain DSM 3637 / PP1) TaxID=1204725 RepID=K2QER5_METFP|nr:SAVED domain-containing protein [Methanobacterium formicicum]EKF86586.1 hypothetical protein A994_03848 [Methanobacterium formicicum DSM 3637]
MSFPPEVKENLFIACHRRCCICHEFKGTNMEVHHIIQKADGGKDTEENGIPLCFDCHANVGSYNSRHPKGNKYSPTELRRHKDQWLEACNNLLNVIDESPKTLEEIVHMGIKSFTRATGNMPDRTLSLIDFFDDNGIKKNSGWNKDLFNVLEEFINKIDPENAHRIHLETHLSIAFVAGYLLDSKSGIEIYPMQKTRGRGKKDWTPEQEYTKDYPKLKEEILVFSSEPKDVVLVLGITYNILDAVQNYIDNSEIRVSKIINCNVDGNIGHNTIIDGTHAIELANSIFKVLNERRSIQEKRNNLHIFAACPVAFFFYLGQLSRKIGKIELYEFNSDNSTYLPTFKLPINRSET